MKTKKQEPWFTTKAWETLTEEEKQTQELREEFYQLAVHYVIQNGLSAVSASLIKRLYVPMNVGEWKMSPSYEGAKEVLERMVQEKILKKVSRSVENAPAIYFYEVAKKQAPFALSKPLQKVLLDIQEKEEKRFLPGQRLYEALLLWVKEQTGQVTIEVPFEVKFVAAEGNDYHYEIFKHNELFASKTFNIVALIKEKKLA